MISPCIEAVRAPLSARRRCRQGEKPRSGAAAGQARSPGIVGAHALRLGSPFSLFDVPRGGSIPSDVDRVLK